MKRRVFKALLTGILLAIAITSGLAQAPFTVLEYTNDWKYLPGNTAPANWFATDYDDALWPTGRGVFAVPTNENVFSVAPVNTPLSTNVGDGYVITYYFRTSLLLNSNLSNAVITASAVIDDGAVIYVNGREVRRIGMPTSTAIFSNTFATRTSEVSTQGPDTFTLAPSNFVQGVNFIAVELHQSAPTSPDAVFGMRLTIQPVEPVVILTDPADQVAEVGHRATFSVQATGSDLRYYWFTNGVRIPGATTPDYTTPLTTFAMSGTVYQVVVSNVVNSLTSAPARLTVVPDVTGPRATNAFVSGVNRVDVRFDEPLLQSSVVQSATNYSLFVLGNTNRLLITNVVWGFNAIRVAANQNLSPTNSYVLCMANIADMHTNVISPNPACVAVGFLTTNTLISLREAWRYNDVETSSLPAAWVTLDYDDDPLTPPYHWADGLAAFAYPFNPPPCTVLGTRLSLGPRTYYFRKRFVVTEEHPADTTLMLRHVVDDGAVFYLNGTEIGRTGMPPGAVDYSTVATRIDNAVCFTTNIAVRGLLSVGTNILAVEVHQAVEPSPQSTDVVFDTELIVVFLRTPVIPQLRVSYDTSAVTLRWGGTGWSLESADNVSGPWIRVATPGNEYASPFGTADERRFFRLVNP